MTAPTLLDRQASVLDPSRGAATHAGRRGGKGPSSIAKAGAEYEGKLIAPEDLRLPDLCALAFVRSPHAHARIERIDAREALALPGVAAVVTGAELRERVRPLAPRLETPGFRPTEWPALADGRVSFAGQAVAAVAAATPYLAADARERVAVTYTPLPAPPREVLFHSEYASGDLDGAFAAAALVVRETFRHARCAACPLEPRGLIARWTEARGLEVWASTQTPHLLRQALAAHLGLPPDRVRVVVPDVGGGFGQKLHVFPEDLAVPAIARLLGRPVKWVEERRENLLAASHAREQVAEVEAAAAADGRVLGLRVRLTSEAGAFHIHPLTQAIEPLGTAMILPGPYRIPAYAYTATALSSPKPPLGAYRGVGMVMGAFVMERTLDLVAERLALDPVEVRRRNLIPPDAYPFCSASGLVYDSGDYPRALARALELGGYAELRGEQARARAAGRALGIGVACYTEYTGMGSETYRQRGMVEVVAHEAAAPGLEAEARFDPPGPTFSGAVHLAVVEVDRETGRVAIRKYVVVEDCGPVLNPLLVEGQIHGAVAQGVGEALLERLAYDGEGQLLTATLMDYALPVASSVPSLELDHLETPSPLTPGGVKGMGEGGTIGAPAAIANAVADAVRGLGIRVTALPILPRDLRAP